MLLYLDMEILKGLCQSRFSVAPTFPNFEAAIIMADLISSSVAHAASPVPTPAALLRRTIYTPTSSWDYATTAISSDQYYMGAIGISGGETCAFARKVGRCIL